MPAKEPSPIVNLRLLILTVVCVSALFLIGLNRIHIDFDVMSSLPDSDPVVSDAIYVLTHHPFQDRVVIDLTSEKAELDELIETARFIEQRLKQSLLFDRVGFGEIQTRLPELLVHISDQLPFLFSQTDLEKQVTPMLSTQALNSRLMSLIDQLSSFDVIGQADLIARDPLNLRNIILGRLSGLMPVKGTEFKMGYPISPDGRHVLILATPKHSGTNTENSRKITETIENITGELQSKDFTSQTDPRLTTAGSFRAALDNEMIVRNDTRKAILFATIGIALMLMLAFPRPYLGLLSLVPAFVGTVVSFFVCALVHESMSILALGFGGAVISITVDHSIAYLLFLDRQQKIDVHQSAHEIRSIGMIAVMTTVGAFLVLTFSGFKILAQIGQFAAMGIAFSFLFIHTVFPKIVPIMPPAGKIKTPLLQRLVNITGKPARSIPALLALIVMMFMLVHVKTDFNVNLQQMNTVSKETLAAEEKIQQTWGNVFTRVFLLVESDTLPGLQDKSDKLTTLLESLEEDERLESPFTPSLLFPGKNRAERNLSAWRAFWKDDRIRQLKLDLISASSALGFTEDAFNPFFEALDNRDSAEIVVPDSLQEMMGISHDRESGLWRLFISLTPRPDFRSRELFSVTENDPAIRVFDAGLFSDSFGRLLSDTFLKMLGIIAVAVIVLIFVFLLDWKLTLVSLVPIAFALVCTLGTLNILDHPLDIPGLMLAIVVAGMGVDYSLFMVRSYQRYGDEAHQSHRLVRTAILLAALSTMIGFGILVTADHYLLHSAGLVSLLGIGYSLLGAYTLLPPLLRRYCIGFKIDSDFKPRGKTRMKRVLYRFSRMEAYHRMFARFKMLMDPLFQELDQFLDQPSHIIDIGTGIGVPAAWILDRWPSARIYGLDPDPERVRVANRILGSDNIVNPGGAPDIPRPPVAADTAIMLDMLHYLDNKELLQTLKTLYQYLDNSGRLIIRVTLPLKDRPPWYRWIESRQIEMRGGRHHYRPLAEITPILKEAGYHRITSKESGKGREETWITARKKPLGQME